MKVQRSLQGTGSYTDHLHGSHHSAMCRTCPETLNRAHPHLLHRESRQKRARGTKEIPSDMLKSWSLKLCLLQLLLSRWSTSYPNVPPDPASPRVSVLLQSWSQSCHRPFVCGSGSCSDLPGQTSTTAPSSRGVCSLHSLLELRAVRFVLSFTLQLRTPSCSAPCDLLPGLAESQGSFCLFRAACWRCCRWLVTVSSEK